VNGFVKVANADLTAISRCISTAQRTASTTLTNSTKSPSPVVDDASAVLAPQRPQSREGVFFVRAHQPRIAGGIGREDRVQPPLYAFSPRGVHRSN
jgi:hypothetical protein